MSTLLNVEPQEPSTLVVSTPLRDAQDTALPKLLHEYCRRDELAQALGRSPRTIDRWHVMREGPPRVQVGRTILYKVESVREWLRSREQQPLSIKTRRSLARKKKQEP
jgi:predicted DNA-binding transcriptional regulator AlpA